VSGQYSATEQTFYLSKKRPFNTYSRFDTDDIHKRPLKEDCIVVPENRIVKLLECLTLEYKYCYVLRNASSTSISDVLSYVYKKIDIKASIFRVQDVYPPEIINVNGVYAKVFYDKYCFVEMVFSDVAYMFDTDGFEFNSSLDFNDGISTVEHTILSIEQLRAKAKLLHHR
jgi:hypothetical protein